MALNQLPALRGYYLLLDREPPGRLKRVYLLLALAVAFVLPLCTVHRPRRPHPYRIVYTASGRLDGYDRPAQDGPRYPTAVYAAHMEELRRRRLTELGD